MYVYYMHVVPKKTRRGHQKPPNWSYRRLWAAMWMLGIELGPLEQLVLLTPQPSLQLLKTIPFLLIFPSLTPPLCLSSFLFSRIRIHMIILCLVFCSCNTMLSSTKVTLVNHAIRLQTTKITKLSHNVLSKFMILFWAVFIMIIAFHIQLMNNLSSFYNFRFSLDR